MFKNRKRKTASRTSFLLAALIVVSMSALPVSAQEAQLQVETPLAADEQVNGTDSDNGMIVADAEKTETGDETPFLEGTLSNDETTSSAVKSNLSEREALVRDFVESTGDWDKWLSYYTDSAREMYEDFIRDENNLADNVGILTVTAADVVNIQKVENTYTPAFNELASFFENDAYETYLVTIDMDVKESTEYYTDGINNKLVILVNNGGVWEVGAQTSAPTELYGKSARGVGYGFLNPGNVPTSINVKASNGIVYTVNFTDFIKNACQNEIGNMGYKAEAIKANAMAIKMCGWWAKVGKYRETYGADIIYGDVAYVNGTTVNSSVSSAVNAISSYRCVSSSATGSKLFYTSYYAGSSNSSGAGTGRLRQNGSNYLATNNGYNWQQILHHYYDNSSYNNPNTGIVRIY